MKLLVNIALGAVLISNAIYLNASYGNGLVGIVVLMGFAFMSILIVLLVNHSK